MEEAEPNMVCRSGSHAEQLRRKYYKGNIIPWPGRRRTEDKAFHSWRFPLVSAYQHMNVRTLRDNVTNWPPLKLWLHYRWNQTFSHKRVVMLVNSSRHLKDEPN